MPLQDDGKSISFYSCKIKARPQSGSVFTDITSYIMIQPTENDTTILHSRCILAALLDDHLLDLFRDGGVEFPFHNLGVLLSGGPRRGGEDMQLKIWVRGQELDESDQGSQIVSYGCSFARSLALRGVGTDLCPTVPDTSCKTNRY